MSDSGASPPASQGQGFREALAHWRLAVHTEVKRASSLPTAMFDATDPMLEMRLAETTEEMLAQLEKPMPHLTEAASAQEQRLESVDTHELARLAARIAERPPQKLDLLAALGTEYIAILADACCADDQRTRELAARHLCHDFGITTDSLDETMASLLEMAQETRAMYAEQGADKPDDRDLDQVIAQVRAQLCAQAMATTADDPARSPQP